MTLTDAIPTLRGSLASPVDCRVWPRDTAENDGDLLVGGVSLTEVAARFGTPCQVLAEDEVRRRCRMFLAALPGVEVAYAGKALSCRAVLRWVTEEGLSLDVCSAGELAVARAAGVAPERILMHGNVKTPEDLKAALACGVGRIVVDSFDEIERLTELAPAPRRVLVRVTPGIDAHTHAAVATAVEDQKFGFSLRDGSAAEAVRRVRATPNLVLAGLHCHLGSQITRVACYEEAVRRLVGLLASVGGPVPELDLGGGFAVPYLPGEDEFDLGGYAARVMVACTRSARGMGCRSRA